MTTTDAKTHWPIQLTGAELATLADAVDRPAHATLVQALSLPTAEDLSDVVRASGIASLCARGLLVVTPNEVHLDARVALVISVLGAPTLSIVVVMQAADRVAAARYVTDDNVILLITPSAPGVVMVAAYEADMSVVAHVRDRVDAFLADCKEVTIAVRREIGGSDVMRAIGIRRSGEELLAGHEGSQLVPVDRDEMGWLLEEVVQP